MLWGVLSQVPSRNKREAAAAKKPGKGSKRKSG